MKNYEDFIKYVNNQLDYESLNDIERNFDEIIWQFIDSQIDIYYYDLRKWIIDNPESDMYMEQVIQDGLIESKGYDFYNHIQYAQDLYMRENNICSFEEWLQSLEDTYQVVGVYSISNCAALQILECSNEYETIYIDIDGSIEYTEVYEDDNGEYYFEWCNENIYFNEIMRV